MMQALRETGLRGVAHHGSDTNVIRSVSSRRDVVRPAARMATTGATVLLGAKVLLVQPERDDRDMYAEYLSYQGLVPLCVQTAHDALQLAGRANIIVTGLLLPGALDGYTLIDRLRCNPSMHHIPIVVLTVCAWDTERERACRAGCDTFLSKPCFPDVLFDEICRLLTGLRRRGATQTARPDDVTVERSW
jgi:two-component system, cell cycle response regulator DivK